MVAANLALAVATLVQNEADRLRDEAIKAAVAAYEADLRKAIGQKALEVSEFYSLEREGPNLKIIVRTA